MASCAVCGGAYEPGDRLCGRCGRPRGVTAATPSPAFSADTLVVEPASPWASPTGVAPAAVAPARDKRDLVLDDVLDQDGALRVEIVTDDEDADDGTELAFTAGGRDVRTHRRDVQLGGRRGVGRRIVAGIAVAAAVVAAGLGVVARRDGGGALTVQLVGGTAAVTGDLVDEPTRRWGFEPAVGSRVLAAVQDDAAVYVLTRAEADTVSLTVHALDSATGAARWTYDVVATTGSIHATPAGIVFNTQADRALAATMLSAADGTVRWQVDGFVTQAPGAPGYGIVQQVSGRVTAALNVIDLSTGSPRWTPAGSLRAGLGIDVLVDATCDALTGRAAADGLIVWRYASPEGQSFCSRSRPQLAVAADRIVVAEGDELVGLDAQGRERWRQPRDGLALAGSSGPYVQLRSTDASAAPSYLDASTGTALSPSSAERVTTANRDRTVLARDGARTLVLLDEGDAVVRADRGTAEPAGLPMPGAGAVGLGRTSVYRTSAAGDLLVGYDLATGTPRWSVPLVVAGEGTPQVWTADRVVVAGTADGGLTVFG